MGRATAMARAAELLALVALALESAVLVADEPVSAIDVSVQAQVPALLPICGRGSACRCCS